MADKLIFVFEFLHDALLNMQPFIYLCY